LAETSATWSGGGNYVWEINDAAGTKGTNWDWLNIYGALNITANSGNKFNLKIVSLTPANATGVVTNFDNTLTYIWTIASASGGITGFNASSFTLSRRRFKNTVRRGDVYVEPVGQ